MDAVIKRVLIAEEVVDAANEQFDYYLENVSEERAMLVSETIALAIERIIADPTGGRVIEGLGNYRRTKAGPFNIYHRLDQISGEALIFLLRHERQRPYAKGTMRNKATKAKKGRGTVVNIGATGEDSEELE